MSIARHLTKRLRSDSSGPSTPTRTFSTRSGKHMAVDKISLPITLLSTTNALSYDAPDVAQAQLMWKATEAENIFPGVSTNTWAYNSHATTGEAVETNTPALSPDTSTRNSSEDEQGRSFNDGFMPSSPSSVKTPTLTDGSSVGSSPDFELNHLSCYFPAPGPAAVKRTPSARLSNKTPFPTIEEKDPAPALPQRAPSHSKRSHVKLARQRSLRSSTQSRTTSPSRSTEAARSAHSPTPSETTTHRTSLDMFSPQHQPVSAPASARPSLDSTATTAQPETNLAQHPFSHELEKLDEVVESFPAIARGFPDEDDEYMISQGLGKFDVGDYMGLIGGGPRFSVYVGDGDGARMGWI